MSAAAWGVYALAMIVAGLFFIQKRYPAIVVAAMFAAGVAIGGLLS